MAIEFENCTAHNAKVGFSLNPDVDTALRGCETFDCDVGFEVRDRLHQVSAALDALPEGAQKRDLKGRLFDALARARNTIGADARAAIVDVAVGAIGRRLGLWG